MMVVRRIRNLLSAKGVALPSTVRQLRQKLEKAEQAAAAATVAREKAKEAETKAAETVARTNESMSRILESRREARDTLKALRARIKELEASAVETRRGLMVMEVKLDIVEGALAVLDRRARRAIPESSGGAISSPPVEEAALSEALEALERPS